MTEETFIWLGQPLAYFDHPYNRTVLNMRRVEIPIARHFLAQAPKGARILEVGNVLAHYGKVAWPVVDLREPGCLNVDVMRWRPPQPVDYLVSISTLEHIGFGKYAAGPVPSYRPEDAYLHLRSFLAPAGRMLATVPLNYNQALDEAILQGQLPVTWTRYVRHTGKTRSGKGTWVECTQAQAFAEGRFSCSRRWPGGMAVLYAEAEP